MGKGKGTSSSKHLRYLSSKNTSKGRIDVRKKLNPKGIRDFRSNAERKLQAKVAGEFHFKVCISF